MSLSWPQLLPAVVLAVAVLVIPGTLLLRAVRLSWLTAVLYAPAVSVAVIVLAGVGVRAVGVGWTLSTGGTVVVAIVAVGLIGARAVRARVPAILAQSHDGPPLRAVAVVMMVSLGAAYLVLAGGASSPLAIPQMPDVVFHLGAVEWMVRHGTASPLDVHQYAQLDGPLAYPGAFHAVVAAFTLWTGLPVTAAWHVLLIVTIGMVWPFGVILLSRVVLGRGSGVIVAAGLLTLVFTSFPMRFLAWGPLWSNLLANALLPTVIAAALSALAPLAFLADRPFGAGRLRALGYAALGLIVLLGTQPNAVATGSVMAGTVVPAALPFWRERLGRPWADRWLRLPVFLVLVAGLIVASTRVIPAKMYVINAHVVATWDVALSELVTVFDGNRLEVGLVQGLIAIGVFRLARDRRRRWVVVSLVTLVVVFMALYAVNGPFVRQFTWLWWNDHYRVRATLVLPAVLCAVGGAVAVGDWLARHVPRLRGSRQGVAALVAVALLVGLRGGIPVHRDVVSATYREAGADYSWVTPQEYAALAQLSDFVPAGSSVAANPYRGGMFFYVAAGVEVFYPTENSLMLSDRRLLGTSLSLVESLPAVCAAAQRHHVDYVLTGGDMHIWGVLDHTEEYAGVDGTAADPRFEAVAQAGPYTLRRVPSCTPGSSAVGFVGPVRPQTDGSGDRSVPSTEAR